MKPVANSMFQIVIMVNYYCQIAKENIPLFSWCFLKGCMLSEELQDKQPLKTKFLAVTPQVILVKIYYKYELKGVYMENEEISKEMKV